MSKSQPKIPLSECPTNRLIEGLAAAGALAHVALLFIGFFIWSSVRTDRDAPLT